MRPPVLMSHAENLALTIERCFPAEVPACLKRLHAQHQLTIPGAREDVTEAAVERAMRELPAELASPTQPGAYNLFQGSPATRDFLDIEEIARVKGWPTVRYKSRHSGGFDTETPSLLMIRVPGASREPPVDYDQYINVALPADSDEGGSQSSVDPVPRARVPGPKEYRQEREGKRFLLFWRRAVTYPSTTTIVSVRRRQGDRPAKVVFGMYNRTSGSSEFMNAGAQSAGSCVGCHPNGLREISPLGYHVRAEEVARGQVKPPENWLAVREMNNAMMMSNGARVVSWGNRVDANGKSRPRMDPSAFGPAYGPLRPLTRSIERDPNGGERVVFPTRTQAFIDSCAVRQSQYELKDIFGRSPGKDNVYKLTREPRVDWQKVKTAMNCASCHNGSIRGTLNGQTDFATIAFKILVDQSMPFGAHRSPFETESGAGPVEDDLNPNERIALTNCLQAEFNLEQGKMTEWLTDVDCRSNQSVPDLHVPGSGAPAHSISPRANPPVSPPVGAPNPVVPADPSGSGR